MIPAPEDPFFLWSNVKREDGASGFRGYPDGAWFCDITRATGAVYREGDIVLSAQLVDHLYQGAASSATARTARGSIAEAPDHAGDIFAVAVLAGHDDDAAVAPEVRCQKNSSMPEGVDDSLVRLLDCAVVLPAIHLPAQSAAQNPDTPVT